MFTVDFNIGEDPIGPLPNEDIVGKCIDEFYGDEYKKLEIQPWSEARETMSFDEWFEANNLYDLDIEVEELD